jgi:hypothetical protein
MTTKSELIAALETALLNADHSHARAQFELERAWCIALLLDTEHQDGPFQIVYVDTPVDRLHLQHAQTYWLRQPRGGRPRGSRKPLPPREQIEHDVAAMHERTGWTRSVCIQQLAATEYKCSPRTVQNRLQN